MKFKVFNKSNLDFSRMKPFLTSFLPFAQKKMGFDQPPSISFVSDEANGTDVLGKTAFYDPNTLSVVIYTDGRHPKDMLRSISHELVHHTQNCQGSFDQRPNVGEGYFQEDEYMQEMEREAYEKGNMCFREWEETHKKQLEESTYYYTGDTKMKLNEWKNQELFGRLLENFGYNAPKVTEEVVEEAEELEEAHYDGRREDDTMEEGHGMCPTCGMNPCACPTMEEETVMSGHPGELKLVKYLEDKLGQELAEAIAEAIRFADDDAVEKVMKLADAMIVTEDLEEAKQFADNDELDGDKDGKPKWADSDDPANKGDASNKKDLDESLIREAVRKAINKAFNK